MNFASLFLFATFTVCIAKPTFQDEIRSNLARSRGAPLSPPAPVAAPVSAPVPSTFLLPPDDASLRQRVAQAYADVARREHGGSDEAFSAMTGADASAVLAAVLNPSFSALSAAEEAELAALSGRWAARAGFGGEGGATKALPLTLLQQHGALSFFRETAPKLLATRARVRAAAKENAERELAEGEQLGGA